jgi:hypothetical protein
MPKTVGIGVTVTLLTAVKQGQPAPTHTVIAPWKGSVVVKQGCKPPFINVTTTEVCVDPPSPLALFHSKLATSIRCIGAVAAIRFAEITMANPAIRSIPFLFIKLLFILKLGEDRERNNFLFLHQTLPAP